MIELDYIRYAIHGNHKNQWSAKLSKTNAKVLMLGLDMVIAHVESIKESILTGWRNISPKAPNPAEPGQRHRLLAAEVVTLLEGCDAGIKFAREAQRELTPKSKSQMVITVKMNDAKKYLFWDGLGFLRENEESLFRNIGAISMACHLAYDSGSHGESLEGKALASLVESALDEQTPSICGDDYTSEIVKKIKQPKEPK